MTRGRGIAAAALAAALLAAPWATRPAAALDPQRPAPSLEPCPEKGAGFVRLPGGRSCTRLSGRVSAGADLRAGPGGTALAPGAVGRFSIDNRTDSDLGEVRTYVRVGNGWRAPR